MIDNGPAIVAIASTDSKLDFFDASAVGLGPIRSKGNNPKDQARGGIERRAGKDKLGGDAFSLS
jgi:hypothetical protein